MASAELVQRFSGGRKNHESGPQLLQVKHGGLFGVGTAPLYIPTETVERVTSDEVHVDRTRVQVATAPAYDPDRGGKDNQMTDLYDYYGYLPYWARDFLPSPSLHPVGSSADSYGYRTRKGAG